MNAVVPRGELVCYARFVEFRERHRVRGLATPAGRAVPPQTAALPALVGELVARPVPVAPVPVAPAPDDAPRRQGRPQGGWPWDGSRRPFPPRP